MSYSLFSGITSGLTSTYSILARASAGDLTPSSISAAMSNSTYAQSLNPAFSSYILSNFSTLDTNKDGKLGSAELANLTHSIAATGLTAQQLTQLGAASGLSGQTLEQVLQHFTDIDKNGDGKVTAAEITAYKLNSVMEKEKTEFRNKAAANQSIFYGDDTAISNNDSSSMLAFKYWNDGNSNGNS